MSRFDWIQLDEEGWQLRTEVGKYLVYVFRGDWMMGKYKERIWASITEGSGQARMICNVKGYKSIEHAKRACERHYKRRVKAIVAEALALGVLKEK